MEPCYSVCFFLYTRVQRLAISLPNAAHISKDGLPSASFCQPLPAGLGSRKPVKQWSKWPGFAETIENQANGMDLQGLKRRARPPMTALMR